MPFDLSEPARRATPPEPPIDEWSDLWGLEEPTVPAVAVVLAAAAAAAAILVLYLVGG